MHQYKVVKPIVSIIHFDGYSKVKAKVFLMSSGVSLDYRFKSMNYGQSLTFSEALEKGIIKFKQQNK